MVRAIKLTDTNVDGIIAMGRDLQFDLSHLHDEMINNTYYGWDTFLIMDGTPALRNITFTALGSESFASTWAFIDFSNTDDWDFSPIRRV